MTIGTQLQQAIASAQSVSASLKTFALETQDQQAKQMFNQLAQNMDNTISALQARLNYVSTEEPQYKQQ
ncbi:DUF1657 domain-containing protein [Tepidibacillus infernus]|uniref:DUF1657 domain-containing protein n=1 Tax=Tepidibacillus decaturensis TaxID=1413211 RepID=A0A135L1T8_9BACI|nr:MULTISPECIES: DUF1657 domain-containing protein [Tepidibacillus]KXG42968.1 hypothetical protein U473_02190 [Tepidibacillus decaturensis]GBF10881.1 hypothetical protein HK1_00897 [Tepidibacillus sp. HK-1]